jgi:hypothetical protein
LSWLGISGTELRGNGYLLEGFDDIALGEDGAALHVSGEIPQVGKMVPVWATWQAATPLSRDSTRLCPPPPTPGERYITQGGPPRNIIIAQIAGRIFNPDPSPDLYCYCVQYTCTLRKSVHKNMPLLIGNEVIKFLSLFSCFRYKRPTTGHRFACVLTFFINC